MNAPADVQQTFSLAEGFETQRFSKLESLLDIQEHSVPPLSKLQDGPAPEATVIVCTKVVHRGVLLY